MAASLVLLGPFAASSFALPILGLFNTGVDNVGNALLPAVGGTVDPHFTIVASPSGPSPAVTVDETIFPIAGGPWVSNSPGSRWIGPSAFLGLGPAGNYTYRTQFNLPANATTVLIAGLWGTDDPSVDIYLNGFPQGQTSAGFTTLVPFGFIASGATINPGGVNFLDFEVFNAGGPTGLRIEALCGHFYVPEPAASAGWLAGAGLLGLARTRRRRVGHGK